MTNNLAIADPKPLLTFLKRTKDGKYTKLIPVPRLRITAQTIIVEDVYDYWISDHAEDYFVVYR